MHIPAHEKGSCKYLTNTTHWIKTHLCHIGEQVSTIRLVSQCLYMFMREVLEQVVNVNIRRYTDIRDLPAGYVGE